MPFLERRVPHLALDHAAIAAMLRSAFPEANMRQAKSLSGGYVNSNYRVWLDNRLESVVLRIFTRDPTACPKEVDVARLVQGIVPIPTMLYADPSGAQCGFPYTITEWVEGTRLEDVLATGDETAVAETAYATGKSLAAIASFTFPATGFFGPALTIAQPFAPAAEWVPAYIARCLCDGHAGERLGPDLTRRLWEHVTTRQFLLSAIPDAAQLVHGDYKGQNLLVSQTGSAWHMAAVLDWEFAFAGSMLFDLGILLRDSAHLPAVYETQILRGLRDQGVALPADWRAITKLLDLVNLCEFLNSDEPRPNLEAYAIERISETVES